MPTIDEILAAMPEPAAEGDHEYLVIDPVTRSITVPEAEKIFGVTGDELADRKYFICPRIVGDGLDLASMFIRVNYRNANGEEDGYLVTDVAVSGDYVTFSWQLWPKVAAYKGAVMFSVCADLPNTPDRKMPDWNTTMASGDVLEGLDPDLGDVGGETSDVVTQLRAETAAQTAAVEACGAAQVNAVEAAAAESTADAKAQIEAKGEAVRASIPEDYTTMAGKVNEFANAIKGNLAGEIVQAGDVSPVEHFLGVKVRGKNLFNLAAALNDNFSVSSDGIYTLTKTSADTRFSKTLEVDVPAGAVTCSFGSLSGNAMVYPEMLILIQFFYTDGTSSSDAFNGDKLRSTTTHNKDICKIRLYLNYAEENGVYATFRDFQVELGTEATEYTPYIDPAGVTVTRYGADETDNPQTFTPLEDGSVPGVVSLAPTMTLLTDTAGVSIECTYNRDTNAVLAEILEKIAALGGTI